MKNQLHNWLVLVELMEKQIWLYIDARHLFPKGAKIWVDAPKGLVNLEQNGKSFSGEGLPACLFVYTDVEKGERPDLDYIEEYAAENSACLLWPLRNTGVFRSVLGSSFATRRYRL